MKQAIIMAAGKGTRMKSDLPKVAHKLCDKTMIECLIVQLNQLGVYDIVSILGYGKDVVEEIIKEKSKIAIQDPQMGTAHAVMQATQFNDKEGYTLVINGDCPLVTSETLSKLYEENEKVAMVVLTVILDDPKQYGRIIRNSEGYIEKIVEYKDCSEAQRNIKEINTGIYSFDNRVLFDNIKKVKNDNAQKEYYITDLVEIINEEGLKVSGVISENPEEVQGINSQEELALANKYMRKLINRRHLNNGVVMIDPETTYIGEGVIIENEVTLHPNVHLYGKVIIKKGSILLPNSFIENSSIGSKCTIDSSRITDSEVGNEVRIGPNAHLRNGCKIDDKNRIGNFVELKNTKLGYDSRCAHLTYLGDCEVGKNVNIGCGVVTVNYDGKSKYNTIIKDGAFVGSNVNLIAPIVIGENALVAAGSTCNKDVEKGAMAIARKEQTNKAGYGDKYKGKA